MTFAAAWGRLTETEKALMRKNKQGVWAKYRGVGGGLAHILKGSANNLLMTPAPRLLVLKVSPHGFRWGHRCPLSFFSLSFWQQPWHLPRPPPLRLAFLLSHNIYTTTTLPKERHGRPRGNVSWDLEQSV